MKDTSWIPSWENPNEYPDPETTSDYQWTWEFLRRNPVYQEICGRDWFKHMAPPPDEAISKFKLSVSSSFPHYSQNNPTEYIEDEGQPGCLHRPLRLAKDVVSILEPKDFETQYRDGEIKTQKLDGYYKVEAYTESLDVVFPKIDLGLSIEDQLRNLKSHLKMAQKNRGYKSKRNHQSLFPKYLRVLDAVTARAHELDIIDIVLNLVLDNPNYNTQSRFDEVLKSALRYRDSDYRFISKESYPHIPKAERKKQGL